LVQLTLEEDALDKKKTGTFAIMDMM